MNGVEIRLWFHSLSLGIALSYCEASLSSLSRSFSLNTNAYFMQPRDDGSAHNEGTSTGPDCARMLSFPLFSSLHFSLSLFSSLRYPVPTRPPSTSSHTKRPTTTTQLALSQFHAYSFVCVCFQTDVRSHRTGHILCWLVALAYH